MFGQCEMLVRTLSFIELHHIFLPTQVMWTLNILVRESFWHSSIVSYIKILFIIKSSFGVLFFFSQALALGDKQVKYFSELFDTLCVPYTEFKKYFFYILLLSAFCGPGCFSGGKDQHSCLPSASKLQHSALLSLCCWLHLSFFSWSHQQQGEQCSPSCKNFLKFSVTFCQTSSSVGVLLGV